MPKIMQITLPSSEADAFISDIKSFEGLISLSRQHNASISPKGDIVGLEITNDCVHAFMRYLDEQGMLQRQNVSITTTQPQSILSQQNSKLIRHDSSEATWEEMLGSISKESNITINAFLIMFIAGVVATVGIATNALHLVVGAMVIAPGFEPIVRISLGLVTRHEDWQRGITDTLKAYFAIILAAALTTLFLKANGENPMGGESSYLPAGVLVSYWTSITLPSLLVTATASIAGALVIITNRSVLTAGVMIALALVPTATILGMSLATGEFATAQDAFIRWLIEVASVAVFSAAAFYWKKATSYKRNMAG
jgi:uncharacterized hydrophobic protein (TIGR00271 family)